MSRYFEICQAIAPYLVAGIGILVLAMILAMAAWLVAGLWYIAIEAWGKRFKSTLIALGVYEDFRKYRLQKRCEKEGIKL